MVQNSRKIWGWIMYDWAAQPYNTLLLTFIFAPYFVSTVVGDPVKGQSLWGIMIACVGIGLAIGGPIFGAIADTKGPRKPWVLFFSALYVFGAFTLWWATPNMSNIGTIMIFFGIGFLGMEWSQVFVNAIMPDIIKRDELGRVSGNGWAIGYIGGLISLIIMLLFFVEQANGKTLIGVSPAFGFDALLREGTRFVGPFSAIWYIVFIIPFFLWVPDRSNMKSEKGKILNGLHELWGSIKNLPKQKSLSAFLLSSMFYRDALFALYVFGGVYASGVLGWEITQIGISGIIGAASAAIFSYFGGFAEKIFGAKTTIITSVVLLTMITILMVLTTRHSILGIPLEVNSSLPDIVFYGCVASIGGLGGTLQANSRVMVIYQTKDASRITEIFGLYGLAGRATSFIAPAAIALVTHLTDSQRLGVIPIIPLFLIGLCLLYWVNDERA